MKLLWNNREIKFQPVTLHFTNGGIKNIFAKKNNKSLRETLVHKRYQNFSSTVNSNYSAYLDWDLGKFLLKLKSNGDTFYLRFLNKYGDKEYCQFYIDDERFQSQKGLYIFVVSGHLQYVGRCLDTFRKRINQGYGKIHPKNCYIDGQTTNCHINSLIAERKNEVAFFTSSMKIEDEIKKLEKNLIRLYQPRWNTSR